MNSQSAVNLEDLRQLTRRKLPRIAFDFIDGGADDEHCLRRNRDAFQRYRLLPRYLVDVSRRDQSIRLLGRRYASSVGPQVPANTLPELVALARSKPGKVDAAIPSVTGQLVLEMLKARNVPLFGVKHKGSADSMTNVLGGHVPVLIDTVAATRTQLGKIKVLAVTTEEPMDSMPGIKTAAEQGLDGFTIAAWNALMAPKGVPAEIQAKLYEEMKKILALPETKKAMADLGFAPAPQRTPAQLNTWLNEERRNYAGVIKRAGMKAN